MEYSFIFYYSGNGDDSWRKSCAEPRKDKCEADGYIYRRKEIDSTLVMKAIRGEGR